MINSTHLSKYRKSGNDWTFDLAGKWTTMLSDDVFLDPAVNRKVRCIGSPVPVVKLSGDNWTSDNEDNEQINTWMVRISELDYDPEVSSWNGILSQLLSEEKESGLTRYAIAKKCGMPESTVHRILDNEREPKISTLLQLIHGLGFKMKIEY